MQANGQKYVIKHINFYHTICNTIYNTVYNTMDNDSKTTILTHYTIPRKRKSEINPTTTHITMFYNIYTTVVYVKYIYYINILF